MASTLSRQYTEMSCPIGCPHTAKRNAHPSVLFLPTLRTVGGVGPSLLVTFFSLGCPHTPAIQTLSHRFPPPAGSYSSSWMLAFLWFKSWILFSFYSLSLVDCIDSQLFTQTFFSEHHTKSGYPTDQLQSVHVQDGPSHLCPKWIALPVVLSQ